MKAARIEFHKILENGRSIRYEKAENGFHFSVVVQDTQEKANAEMIRLLRKIAGEEDGWQ